MKVILVQVKHVLKKTYLAATATIAAYLDVRVHFITLIEKKLEFHFSLLLQKIQKESGG